MNPIATPSMITIADHLKRQCLTGFADGRGLTPYMRSCIALDPSGAVVMFTRDTEHHTSGWLKNPDYERCYHLSISFRDPETGQPRPFELREAALWVQLFFARSKRLLWEESPKTPEGIQRGVRHYRLFCDEHWRPIKPRGEVYSTEFTELGWRSWSEVQADAMTAVMHAAQ